MDYNLDDDDILMPLIQVEVTEEDIEIAWVLLQMSNNRIHDEIEKKCVRFSFPIHCYYFTATSPPIKKSGLRTVIYPAPHSSLKSKIIVKSRVLA